MLIKKIKYIISLFIITSIGIAGCSQNSNDRYPPKDPEPNSAPAASSPTGTPESKLKPTSKPTQAAATETVEVIETPFVAQVNPTEAPAPEIFLPLDIVYQGAGGGGAGCDTYYRYGEFENYEFPAVILLNHGGLYENIGHSTPGFLVCLVEMPVDTPLLVVFSNADEQMVLMGKILTDFSANNYSDLTWQIPENFPDTGDATKLENGTSVIDFDLWWPSDLPAGNWQVEVVNLENSEVVASAEYEIINDDIPWIEAVAEKNDYYSIRPAEFSISFPYCKYLNSYENGDQIAMIGAGYPPATQLQIGIYDTPSFDDENFSLLSEKTVVTNRNGEFSFEFPLELLSSENAFLVYAIWDSDFEITDNGLVKSGGIETCFLIPYLETEQLGGFSLTEIMRYKH
jgi:hypothetical protein